MSRSFRLARALLFHLAFFRVCVSFLVQIHRPESHSKTASSQLNGIRGFNIWFENEFSESIVKIDQGSEETFDHVLIDMNHIIHVVTRRSRGDEAAVRIIMSQLDRILSMFTPTKSLVLAIDGAPGAAKLATQRSRRYGTVVRTAWKLEHFDKLKISPLRKARRKRSYQAEIQSLQITPGTEFQNLMESTLQYWAWQRLQHGHGKLRDVRIFISPSTVPGEGEHKLTEWIMQRPRLGQSVAIFGRDSDLLLQGLIIPPSWTHNIFVIQSESGQEHFSISLWETTRKLVSWLPPQAPPEQILQVRTDLVLMMMLNGNDYLPKLRGCKGFSHLCGVYRKLLAEEFSTNSNKSGKKALMGLVDPDSLELRLDFSIRFFEELSRNLPRMLYADGNDSTENSKMPLWRLNNLIDAGFLPRPLRFKAIKSDDEIDDDDDDKDLDDGDVEEEDDREAGGDFDEDETHDFPDGYEDGNDNEMLDDLNEGFGTTIDDGYMMQLTLGHPDSDNFLVYEAWHDAGTQRKTTNHKLALMALNDFFGMDPDTSEKDSNSVIETWGNATRGYSWEISQSAPGRVDRYLGGLLWNLQTYQDGICADYGFNYGRRLSPYIGDIVNFLKEAKAENRTVGCRTLLGTEFTPPIPAGLACLAALPAQVKHLIPEPYRWIPDETVEQFYADCMDKVDNCFDMKKFEALCNAEIARIRNERGESDDHDRSLNTDSADHGRRIMFGDHWWTVVSRTNEPLAHPFDPPAPPSKKFAELRPNPRVRVSRVFAISEPRPRSVWDDHKSSKGKRHRPEAEEIPHSSLSTLLRKGRAEDLMRIPYKIDYAKERQRVRKVDRLRETEGPLRGGKSIDIIERMKEFNKVMPSATPSVNKEGLTALYLLSEMHKLEMLGPVQFNISRPSNSSFASWDPERYEHYILRVSPSKNMAANVLNQTLLFEQDRDLFQQTRQSIKQHLAGLALSAIVGAENDWTNWTFADLRWSFPGQNTTGIIRPEEVEGHKNYDGAMGGAQQDDASAFNNMGNDISMDAAIEPMKEYNQIMPTRTPTANPERLTALYILQELHKLDLLGPIHFDVARPSNSSLASLNPERFMYYTLQVFPSQKKPSHMMSRTLCFGQDRDMFNQTDKSIKQNLASLALSEIVGPENDWTKLKFADIRGALEGRTVTRSTRPQKVNGKKQPNGATNGLNEDDIPIFNTEGQSALECLNMLRDSKLIGNIEFSFSATVHPSALPDRERATLVVGPGEGVSSLVLKSKSWSKTFPRKVQDARKMARQRLAAKALSNLVGPGVDWTQEVPFSDFKMTLAAKAAQTNSKSSTAEENAVDPSQS